MVQISVYLAEHCPADSNYDGTTKGTATSEYYPHLRVSIVDTYMQYHMHCFIQNFRIRVFWVSVLATFRND